jgi:hypothetical protein
MERKYLWIYLCLILAPTLIFAQKSFVKPDDFNMLVKQIGDSLPKNWSLKIDQENKNEIIIQSVEMDLEPDMTSNDPVTVNGKCVILIKIVPRVAPDSIQIIRLRNKKMRSQLPAQDSKTNLKDWYKRNEKVLTVLDSEPTNYDSSYSYRITCRRLPKNSYEKKTTGKIFAYLDKLFPKYY